MIQTYPPIVVSRSCATVHSPGARIWGMADQKSTAELVAATQEALIDFLRTDLAMCVTFADLAETELGLDRQGALEAFKRAERGYEIIEQFVMRVQDTTKRQEIEQKMNLLRSRLATLEASPNSAG